jgi:hypothetical protein
MVSETFSSLHLSSLAISINMPLISSIILGARH